MFWERLALEGKIIEMLGLIYSAEVLIGDAVNWNKLESNQILVYEEKEKPENTGKNLSWQSRKQINPTHDGESRIRTWPHLWKASALNIAPPLLSQNITNATLINYQRPF